MSRELITTFLISPDPELRIVGSDYKDLWKFSVSRTVDEKTVKEAQSNVPQNTATIYWRTMLQEVGGDFVVKVASEPRPCSVRLVQETLNTFDSFASGTIELRMTAYVCLIRISDCESGKPLALDSIMPVGEMNPSNLAIIPHRDGAGAKTERVFTRHHHYWLRTK